MTVTKDANRGEVLAEVCELLEREAAKSRTNYDEKTADVIDVLRAKVQALEKR